MITLFLARWPRGLFDALATTFVVVRQEATHVMKMICQSHRGKSFWKRVSFYSPYLHYDLDVLILEYVIVS